MESAKATIARDPILVDFGLQGGGSHGAFTWGVLDRLLEEPWLEIDGISGTSAGAMNAVVLVDGYAKGGAVGAREALESFWRRVSEAARFSPFQRSPLDLLLGRWTMDFSPAYIAADLMSRVVSPYFMNPKGYNPLDEILTDLVDFTRLSQRVVDAAICHYTLAVMTTAGLYETSGDWLYDVGLPGKSGIGGGIVTVSPGKGGLGTFAPPLDSAGNSVKGQLVAKFLSQRLGMDLFVSKAEA